MDITKAIYEEIRKHLPEAELSALKAALDEREIFKKQLESSERDLERSRGQVSEYLRELCELRPLKEKEDLVNKTQIELDKKILEVKLEAEQAKVNSIQELARTVFANRSYTMVTTGTMPVANRDGYIHQEPFDSYANLEEKETR